MIIPFRIFGDLFRDMDIVTHVPARFKGHMSEPTERMTKAKQKRNIKKSIASKSRRKNRR